MQHVGHDVALPNLAMRWRWESLRTRWRADRLNCFLCPLLPAISAMASLHEWNGFVLQLLDCTTERPFWVKSKASRPVSLLDLAGRWRG